PAKRRLVDNAASARCGSHSCGRGDCAMQRAIRSGISIRLASLCAFVVALGISDVRAGDPPAFGYGVAFSNATQAYDFVSFPLVTPIAPLDGQLVAATAVGTSYARLYAID